LDTYRGSKRHYTVNVMEHGSHPELGDITNEAWNDGNNSSTMGEALDMGTFTKGESLRTVSISFSDLEVETANNARNVGNV
jgi:hypothetical protein